MASFASRESTMIPSKLWANQKGEIMLKTYLEEEKMLRH